MRHYNTICLLLLVVILSATACRSPKEKVLFYQPTFDQTKETIQQLSQSDSLSLDTTVLIWSNLRPIKVLVVDTFHLPHTFSIKRAELLIDTEILNEKPPYYDTMLVVNNYLYRREWFEGAFPERTDSVFIVSDPLAMGSDLSEKYVDRDIFTKNFLSRKEIMMFQNRDFSKADSTFAYAAGDAPFDIGDSIPFQPQLNLLYFDGNLLLAFDTVYIPKRIPIPQFSMNQLLAFTNEDIQHDQFLYYEDEIVFMTFFPNEVDIYMEMVKVEGGDFVMGNNDHEPDEGPATKLTINSFLMSKYEITNHLFCQFLNKIDVTPDGLWDDVKLIHFDMRYTKIYYSRDSLRFYPNTGFENHPVLNVTWYGADQFARFAITEEDKRRGLEVVRVPTEAEWEYAARGGKFAKKRMLNWDHSDFEYVYSYAGSDYIRLVGYMVDNSRGYCSPVGQLMPNELGIHDMTGNLWEWCFDTYNPDFLKTVRTSRNPVNLGGPGIMVVKGGSWSSDAYYCRINNRNKLSKDQYNPYLGFRIYKKW